MAHRARLRRLERKATRKAHELRCNECGWEITVYSSAPWADLIVLEWMASSAPGEPLEYASKRAPFAPHKSMGKLFNHEHPYEAFEERRCVS